MRPSPALSPSDEERFPRKISRIKPLNRSRRRESALILCLENKQMRRLTSAATRFVGGEGRVRGRGTLYGYFYDMRTLVRISIEQSMLLVMLGGFPAPMERSVPPLFCALTI